MPLQKHLRQDLVDFDCAAEALDQLALHWALLSDWQQRMNLTAIESDARASLYHYRDCLEVLRVLEKGPILDVGSGAGFPGIPLAIMRPQWSFTLLEPRRKRVSFLRSVKARLGLENVTIIHGKSHDTPPSLFAAVVSRATFSDMAGIESCFPWLQDGGLFVAMRTEASGSEESRLHPYLLQDDRRVLEIWQK